MVLSISLFAENTDLSVYMHLSDSDYKISVTDKKKDKSSIRGFDNESSMWSYIEKLNINKEDFKVIPF